MTKSSRRRSSAATPGTAVAQPALQALSPPGQPGSRLARARSPGEPAAQCAGMPWHGQPGVPSPSHLARVMGKGKRMRAGAQGASDQAQVSWQGQQGWRQAMPLHVGLHGSAVRQCNFHVPVSLVSVQVPQASSLRTMEQTFVNLLTPELNAPWVRRLVRSTHSQSDQNKSCSGGQAMSGIVETVQEYRRRAPQLRQVQPSVFRSPRMVTAIVHVLQLMFDLASDCLTSFLAQTFSRSNYVDADTVYSLYRVAAAPICSYGSKCLGSVPEHFWGSPRHIPYHIPTTRIRH